MKKVVCFTLAALLLACSVSAANWKFGYINSEQIFKQSREVQDAQGKYDKEVQQVAQKVNQLEKEIKDMQEEYERQKLMMTDERKKQKEEELQKKMVRYKSLVDQYFGKDGEVYKRNAELTKPIIEKINKIIKKLSEREGFDLILDISSGAVGYAKPEYDLTDDVVKELNRGQ
ncbi:MAG: OmpH family outer membrane protein [Fibrobacterota bacterium]